MHTSHVTRFLDTSVIHHCIFFSDLRTTHSFPKTLCHLCLGNITFAIIFDLDEALFLQGDNADEPIDILVKTIPKGRHMLNDQENITGATTQAGLGLRNEFLVAWDVWTRGLPEDRLPTLESSSLV